MIFQFHTNSVTFSQEDRDYFEEKLLRLVPFFGQYAGDEDSIMTTVHVEKSKHKSGDRFESKAHLTGPQGADFVASTDSESIRGLADKLEDILRGQIKKFHDKKA